MDKNLAALKPALVWKHFAEIVNIPRPSGSEDKIRQYLVDFAVAKGIEHKVDEAGNVYMRKAATPGYENRKGIVIQAHMDMVPQKNNDKEFDFINDPIEAYIDGEWVTANGTTLGADNARKCKYLRKSICLLSLQLSLCIAPAPWMPSPPISTISSTRSISAMHTPCSSPSWRSPTAVSSTRSR